MFLVPPFILASGVKDRKPEEPTCGVYEAWVGVICDEGDRQLSEVQFEGPSDDVDVLVST